MGAKKILQLNTITTPSLSGFTAVVDSGVTYNTTLSSLKSVLVENGNTTINGNLTITGTLTYTEVFNVTYLDFVNLINVSGLTTAAHYKITDFATSYYMIDGEGVKLNDGSSTVGIIEPLVVFCTSPTTIDVFAHSELHPNDIIYYDWNPDNFVNDYAFNGVPEFKGVITFRQDTVNNISAGWDIRNINFRRWESTAPVWDSGTTYNKNDVVLHDNQIYKSLIVNTNREPSLLSSNSQWVLILNLISNKYWNTNSTSILFDGIVIPSGEDYNDFTLVDFDPLTSFNITISNSVGVFRTINTRLLNITIFGTCRNITVGLDCKIFTIGSGSNGIDIRSGCYRIIIGRECENLLFRSNCYRTIVSDNVKFIDFGINSNNNLIGQYATDLFLRTGSSNISFGYDCYSIIIESDCWNVTIGSNCSKIHIQSEAQNIEIRSDSKVINIGQTCYNILINNLTNNNTFENLCHDINIPMNSMNNTFETSTFGDLTGSSHAVSTYPCVIFKNAGGVNRLRYYDASDNLVITGINV